LSLETQWRRLYQLPAYEAKKCIGCTWVFMSYHEFRVNDREYRVNASEEQGLWQGSTWSNMKTQNTKTYGCMLFLDTQHRTAEKTCRPYVLGAKHQSLPPNMPTAESWYFGWQQNACQLQL
jgi:hypothetical protein